MNKSLALIFASLLLLGGCGSDDDSGNNNGGNVDTSVSDLKDKAEEVTGENGVTYNQMTIAEDSEVEITLSEDETFSLLAADNGKSAEKMVVTGKLTVK
ncbi:hypothetical protein [Vibrio owensii]|uniref:hypothetical protein n=1 Tax=Vibrio owensii TaxID=696485 RepID=UPI002F40C474